MADIASRRIQRFEFSRMKNLLLFATLFVGLIPTLVLSFDHVAYASTQHIKPQLARLRKSISTVTAPSFTRSRYITLADVNKPNRLNTDGCTQAKSGVGGIVVLDFGEIIFQNGSGYGTYLPGTIIPFVSNNAIQSLVQNYLLGFQRCNSSGTVLDLGIGTNNEGFSTSADATSAGEEWATLVYNVGSWIGSQGISNEYADGASDIELGFDGAVLSRAWTDGFDTVSSNTGVIYFNYGDAAGCPTVDNTTNQPCNDGWTQSDIAYVSWDAAAAYPLPEIYATTGANALEWQSIDYYQHNNPGSFGPMSILGSFTQYKACQQTGICIGNDNTPGGGWKQLYKALNSSATTAQSLTYATDIQWDY